MYYGQFNFENGYILVVLFIATPAKTESLFKYCIKTQSQPMTIVKYNNCEFTGQNTTECRSDRHYLGWEGQFDLCQHEYGCAGPFNLYCAIDDSVMLDQHMQHILYDYVICEILLITYQAMLFINYSD
jgi:hypothetical protein